MIRFNMMFDLFTVLSFGNTPISNLQTLRYGENKKMYFFVFTCLFITYFLNKIIIQKCQKLSLAWNIAEQFEAAKCRRIGTVNSMQGCRSGFILTGSDHREASKAGSWLDTQEKKGIFSTKYEEKMFTNILGSGFDLIRTKIPGPGFATLIYIHQFPVICVS